MKRFATTCLVLLFLTALTLEQARAQPVPLAPPAHPSVEVLTDTMGFDFTPYLAEALKTVRGNWYGLIPESASMKQGRLVLELSILKDGSVSGLKVAKSSGDVALDRPAYGSIANSNPFPPLPPEFKGSYLGLRVTYLYNLQPLVISPKSVKLSAGETQQFTTTPVGSQETVEWRLEGCPVQATCGSISATGLYTAPKDLADAREVKVVAVVRSHPAGNSTAPLADMGQDTATVTLVKSEKPAPPTR